PLLEDVEGAGLPVERLVPAPAPQGRGFLPEPLGREPIDTSVLAPIPSEWMALRTSRSFQDDRFRGTTGPRAPSVYSVSRLERYLECPFKYFAAHVLKLPEERDEQSWMTPQERGHFVHEVF